MNLTFSINFCASFLVYFPTYSSLISIYLFLCSLFCIDFSTHSSIAYTYTRYWENEAILNSCLVELWSPQRPTGLTGLIRRGSRLATRRPVLSFRTNHRRNGGTITLRYCSTVKRKFELTLCLHCAKRTRIFSRPAWPKQGYPMSSLFALRGDTNSIEMRAVLGPRINQSPGARCLGSSASRQAPPVRCLPRARLFTMRRGSPLPSKVHVYLVSGLPSSRSGWPGGCGSTASPRDINKMETSRVNPR